MSTTDPHHNEGDAAAAAVGDFYGIGGSLTPGRIVTVCEPFSHVMVRAIVQHCHGDVVLVVTERGETLEFDRDEINRI